MHYFINISFEPNLAFSCFTFPWFEYERKKHHEFHSSMCTVHKLFIWIDAISCLICFKQKTKTVPRLRNGFDNSFNLPAHSTHTHKRAYPKCSIRFQMKKKKTKIDANPQNIDKYISVETWTFAWKLENTWTKNKMKNENYKMKWKQQMFEWKTMCICVDQIRNIKFQICVFVMKHTENGIHGNCAKANRQPIFWLRAQILCCLLHIERKYMRYALNKVQNPKHKICSAQAMRLIFVLNSFKHKIMKLYEQKDIEIIQYSNVCWILVLGMCVLC